jgi:hypothetical protein
MPAFCSTPKRKGSFDPDSTLLKSIEARNLSLAKMVAPADVRMKAE